MQPTENYTSGFLYDIHLDNYMRKEVHTKLGISFDEYLNKPRYEIELMMKAIERFDKYKSELNANLLDGLGSEVKDLKL